MLTGFDQRKRDGRGASDDRCPRAAAINRLGLPVFGAGWSIANIRSLCWFLELSDLDEFVSSSYGAQQAVAEEMESLLVTFGQEEDQRLAASMTACEISLCEDETFHFQICLAAGGQRKSQLQPKASPRNRCRLRK